MAFVTPISSAPGQVEYRLGQGHGCTPPGDGSSGAAAERQFSYHADGRERPLTWIGRGLADVGIVAGSELTSEQFDLARDLMAGKDPRTGDRLVEAKLAVPDDAKVPLVSLVAAIRGVAAEASVPVAEALGRQPSLTKAFDAAVRSVARVGEAAQLRADEAGRLADAAGLDVDEVWGADVYESAVRNLFETRAVTQPDGTVVEERVPRRIRVGNAGYDVTFTLPKSLSLLLAFSKPEFAAEMERTYLAAVESTFAWLEDQTAYGMRGKHGDGHVARTVPGSGLLGWAMIHRAARPTDAPTTASADGVAEGASAAADGVGDDASRTSTVPAAAGSGVGDPHWHVHVTVANMTLGSDGRWSTIAAGGRDLMRHAPVIDHLLKAQIRHELTTRHGMEFARNERTGAWELAAIPDATLRRFSKRKNDIDQLLTALGHNPAAAERAQQRIAEQRTRGAKNHATAAADATLQQLWQAEERAAGSDPDAHVRHVLAPDSPTTVSATTAADIDDMARALQNPDTGLTAHTRRFTRTDALARVADLIPHGVATAAELERITDQVLACAGFVELRRDESDDDAEPARRNGQTARTGRAGLAESHMRNAQQHTTQDVVDAETVILTAAQNAHPDQSPIRVQNRRTIDLAVATVEAQQGHSLSGEQRAALERLVTEGRAVDAVNGAPGTGKTTLMRAVRVVFEAAGHVVAGAATAAMAAQHLQTESGITSATIASYLTALDRHEAEHAADTEPADGAQSDAGEANSRRPSIGADRQLGRHPGQPLGPLDGVDVLVVDEANLTEDRDRARLYAHANLTGTRIIEIGDALQLRGVGVGSLFGHVHRLVGGLELVDNRRQVHEDERAAITAWRLQRHVDALHHWADQHRLTATNTHADAISAMLAEWLRHRGGAPTPHAEMRGLLMLAARNDTVRRLNTAAQALRHRAGELGPGRDYQLPAGRSLRLHVGDHVLLRINDRGQLATDTVLNGYRGVVTHIHTPGDTTPDVEQHDRGTGRVGNGNGNGGTPATANDRHHDHHRRRVPTAPAAEATAATSAGATPSDDDTEHGAVTIEWQLDTLDGPQLSTTTVSPAYLAAGGVDLAYALTIHKAEGLTVGHRWAHPDGHTAGGTVLVATDGADNPALHVATSRHTHTVHLYAARADLETPHHEHQHGAPHGIRDLQPRVIAALADHAAATTRRRSDEPVLPQLGLIDITADTLGGPRPPDPEESHEPAPEPPPQPDQRAAARAHWEAAADAVTQRQRTDRERAEQLAARRDRAATVLREAWADTPDLVDRVLAAPAMPALAHAVHDLEAAGHDAEQILRDLPVDAIAVPTIRDPAAYTTALLDTTHTEHQPDHELSAANRGREQAREQAADLLADAWAGQPAAAAVTRAPAYDAFVRALGRHTDAGADPHQLVAAIPTRTLLEPSVRDPAALATYHLHRIAEHHRSRETPAPTDTHVDREHVTAAADLLRTCWQDHPRDAGRVTAHPSFRHVAQRMHDAHQLGHDVSAALRQLDPEHVVGDRGNPAARLTYALTQALYQPTLQTRPEETATESITVRSPEPAGWSPDAPSIGYAQTTPWLQGRAVDAEFNIKAELERNDPEA